jgi:hypothetical protein
VITRFSDGHIQGYAFSPGPVAASLVDPVAAFPVGVVEAALDGYAVAPDLSRALYTTTNRVTCIDRDGSPIWQLDFEPSASVRPNAHNSCEFSPDCTVAWIYRPDAIARKADGDTWLAVDAHTGQVVARADLSSVGHGGVHCAHPDGVHMLLDVGEGQDGSRLYRGRLDGDRIDLFEYAWGSRILVSVTSDGRHLMTVDHDSADAAFHAYPDGEVLARVPIQALGHDLFDAFIEPVGGYVNDSTAVVTVSGEGEDEQVWFERYLVDPRTGEVRGRLDTPSAHAFDFEPLGDGSWLSKPDGHLRRYALEG